LLLNEKGVVEHSRKCDIITNNKRDIGKRVLGVRTISLILAETSKQANKNLVITTNNFATNTETSFPQLVLYYKC
jgi:hypothetical protein